MEEMFDPAKLSGLLRFHVERKMVFLSKGFLEILEGYLASNYITEEEFKAARKRVLDRLGDAKRENEEMFSKFKVYLI